MRAHGLSGFPDPTVGSNGLPGFSINGNANSDLNPQSSQYQTAQKSCKSDLPDLGPTTPAEKAAANAEALKYSECMRSHGEPDFPDPNGQGVIQVKNATGILQQNSPQFVQAAKSCQSLDKGFAEQFSSSFTGGPPGSDNPGSGS